MKPWYASEDYKRQREFETEERIDLQFSRLEQAVISIQTWINGHEKPLEAKEQPKKWKDLKIGKH